jgi:membrane protein
MDNNLPVRERLGRLMGRSSEGLGRVERALQFQIHLWRYSSRRLKDINAMAMSAALSFRTIFALVPILVLAFLLLKTVGIVPDSKNMLHDVLEYGGMTQIVYGQSPETPAPPAAEEAGPAALPDGAAPADGSAAREGARRREVTVAGGIERALKRAEEQLTLGRLGPIGSVLLIWTALTLLMTMELSLNRIFEAPRSRSLARRVIIYWSVVSLGPLVLMAASYAGDRAFATLSDMPYLAWVLGITGWMSSFMLGALFLGTVYTLMPNTHVPWRPALIGGAVAFLAWMAARWGFGLYVHYVGLRSLYGALALIPLFLLWLNLSWMIFLMGAQLVFALANRSRIVAGSVSMRRILSQWDVLAAAVAVARANKAAGKPVPLHDIAAMLAIPEDAVEPLMANLAAAGVVCHVAGGARRSYVLARPAETILVAVLLDLGSTEPGRPGSAAWSPEIAQAVAQVRQRTGAGLERLTLASLVG